MIECLVLSTRILSTRILSTQGFVYSDLLTDSDGPTDCNRLFVRLDGGGGRKIDSGKARNVDHIRGEDYKCKVPRKASNI